MHARLPAVQSSDSETSEDLDSGTLPPSERSDPFLEEGTQQHTAGGLDRTTELPSAQPLQRASSAERVLSYDPNDPRTHVFRTFQHVPGPPARPRAVMNARLPRCFCGGGESMYGSACMCGGASSFARAAAYATSERTATGSHASDSGTCDVQNGMSLIDDTSDSNIINTPTATDAGSWMGDTMPARRRGRRGRYVPAGARIRSSLSPIDSGCDDAAPCACGDVTDSGIYLDSITTRLRPSRISIPWHRPADPALHYGNRKACRSTSESSLPCTATLDDLIGCEDDTSVLDAYRSHRNHDAAWRAVERKPAAGQCHGRGALRAALRRVPDAPSATQRHSRDVAVEVHPPSFSLRRALWHRVPVPRLPLPFLHARGLTARSASAEPRRPRTLAA